MIDFSEHIRAKRESEGLSLREAAQQSGVHYATLSRIEAGKDCTYRIGKRLESWLGFESPAPQGETLRDKFAGQIAAALCSATDSSGMWMAPCDDAGVKIVAERSYAVADAMMAERAKGGAA